MLRNRIIRRLKINRIRGLYISLILLVTALVGGVLWVQTESMKYEHAQSESDHVRLSFMQTLQQIVIPIQQGVRITRDWGEHGLLDMNDSVQVRQLFSPLLRGNTSVTSVTLVSSSGTLVTLREQEDSLYLNSWLFNGVRETSSAYNPQNRLWYKGAISQPGPSIYWTIPYQFYSSGIIGLSASTAWNIPEDTTRYVVAFHIQMTELFQELLNADTLREKLGGKLFVFDDSLSFVELSLENDPNNYDSITPMLLTNSSEQDSLFSYVRQSLLDKDGTSGKVSPLQYKDKPYWASISSFKVGEHTFYMGWLVAEGVVAKSVYSQQSTMILIAVVIVLIAVVVLLLILKLSLSGYKVLNSAAELHRLFSETGHVEAFLARAVKSIAKMMQAPVCSIYFFDEPNNCLVLKATEGLNDELVGKTTLSYGEGIVGQTLQEVRPMRVNSASSSLNYHYVEGLNEDQYDSFLAVPIIRGLHKVGVLVVQREGRYPFSARDIKTLDALAQQLTSVLEAAGGLLELFEEEKAIPIDPEMKWVKGRAGAPGYAHGKARVQKRNDILMELRKRHWKQGYTLEDFEEAMVASENDLDVLQANVNEKLADSVAMIFTAHIYMLKDRAFGGAIRTLIENGVNPPEAVLHVTEEMVRTFTQSPHRQLRDKADDVKDLAVRLLSHIEQLDEKGIEKDGCIVISRELFPSDILELSSEGVIGVVLKSGGITSHVAILCRSMNLPLLITGEDRILDIPNETELLLNAHHGIVYLNPDESLIEDYMTVVGSSDKRHFLQSSKVTTADKIHMKVMVNINLMIDVAHTPIDYVAGVGLYRSEFPFMLRDHFPSEEEQFKVYQRVANYVGHKPFVFRTLDVGGDKALPYYDAENEENPFLGVRAIRFSFREQGEFQKQLRAILRAGVHSDLRIMFPMIQSTDEVIQLKRILEECKMQLHEEGVPYHTSPKIGIMVELPAAVSLIDLFAEMVDFVSLGTNDLIQYLLAVDRTNALVAHLYKPHHPAVLRSIDKVVRVCIESNVEVSICGDMANSLAYLPFLVGVGLTHFSVDSAFISRVQEFVGELTLAQARRITREMLACTSVEEVEVVMEKHNLG